MSLLYSQAINVHGSSKEISVYCDDAAEFDQRVDVLTTSAYVGSYYPTPRTLFKALYDRGISVYALSKKPEIDLRERCNTWLSREIGPIGHKRSNIGRIGCIEFINYHKKELRAEQEMISSIQAYFLMLQIAAVYGVNIETLALPLLGCGSQGISGKFMIVPLINECIKFLTVNDQVKRIFFIEKDPVKAQFIADQLETSLRFKTEASNGKKDNGEKREESDSPKSVFISYSSEDKNIADNLCSKLERNGIKVWYAPRNVVGPYADSIARAIDDSSYFVVILSKNSIISEHVLNEIDLAFQNLPEHIKFKPLKIDDTMFTPAFRYYLSRQHWMDATDPPLEARLNEFVKDILDDN